VINSQQYDAGATSVEEWDTDHVPIVEVENDSGGSTWRRSRASDTQAGSTCIPHTIRSGPYVGGGGKMPRRARKAENRVHGAGSGARYDSGGQSIEGKRELWYMSEYRRRHLFNSMSHSLARGTAGRGYLESNNLDTENRNNPSYV
jgi:hypothetical protein